VIHITFEEGRVKSNNFVITDLKKPFKNIVSSPIVNPENLARTFEKPGGLIRSMPYPFYVQIKKQALGSLFRGTFHGYPSYWVYETNSTLSPLFRDKVLHKILQEDLMTESETYQGIRQHFKILINLLVRSYAFDVIVTDIKNIASFTFSIPIIHDSAILTRMPQPITPRLKTIRALHRGSEELPLSLFDWQLLDHISLQRYSSFDVHQLRNYKNILLLIGTNVYYAGFLAKEIRKLWVTGRQFEPLPITLFRVV